MPKGQHSEERPSFVITAKMNPEVSELERQAWDIWQNINRRDVIKAGFTSKAELLATALIQYYDQNPPTPESEVQSLLKQILSKLNNGGYSAATPELTEEDILMEFAQNRQMMENFIDQK